MHRTAILLLALATWSCGSDADHLDAATAAPAADMDGDYGNCFGDRECAAGSRCERGLSQVCAPPCGDASDCPAPSSGSPELACVSGYCHLHCRDDTSCPAGMLCKVDEFESGPHCVWCGEEALPPGSTGFTCPD